MTMITGSSSKNKLKSKNKNNINNIKNTNSSIQALIPVAKNIV
ncbi:MAG: hypothetical protein Q8R47_03600 [Nanoarchaeota archaeon]|nr:hypothetical protein [Nanoarchaeota archaeon]